MTRIIIYVVVKQVKVRWSIYVVCACVVADFRLPPIADKYLYIRHSVN